MRIASDESQPFIWIASGWVVRSLPVFFLYSSTALSKIGWKLEVDEEDTWTLDDMEVAVTGSAMS